MANRLNDLVMENCRIIFRNFSGKEGKFNPAGRRNFNVVLDERTAKALMADGWNVKMSPPRDLENEEPMYRMEVSVNYNHIPPKIFMISGNVKTELDEDSVNALDYAEIENVDMIVRPYIWEVNGKTGVKAYVKSMYVTIVQDEFEEKYRHLENGKSDDYPKEDDEYLPF